MAVIEPGLSQFAPRGFILSSENDVFPPKTKVFIIANLKGQHVPKWATASSYIQARRGFFAWFGNQYPRVNPPRWEDVHIFRKLTPKAPPKN